jgi:hypothetical protein
MNFLRNKMRSWLGVDAAENAVDKLKNEFGLVDKRVGSLDERLHGLCDVLHVGIDVAGHSRDSSWAVIAVRGKEDRVYFYDLGKGDAQSVHQFLERLPKNRCAVDAPQYLPVKRIFKF